MSQQDARADIKEATIEVTVIRKDGTREDHGVVSYYHRNPLKRAAWAAKQKLRSKWNMATLVVNGGKGIITNR
jgi:hypothetical protein